MRKNITERDTPIPTSDEYDGALAAVIRLQYVYNLSIDDLADGLVMGYQAPPLDASDFYNLGKMAMQLDKHDIAIQWLTKAKNNNVSKQNLSNIVHDLAKAYYRVSD